MYRKQTPARLEHLGELVSFVSDFVRCHRFPEGRAAQVELVTEEVLVNIFHHAYPPGEGEVGVSVAMEGEDRCVIEFTDHGTPFDPLSAPEPDVKASLDERRPGGLGVLFIRTLVDEVRYLRRGDSNILTLTVSRG